MLGILPPEKVDNGEEEEPPAGPEPKIEDDIPELKRDGTAGRPEEPKIDELGADVEPNKDKLGVEKDGALAEVSDPATLKAENGVDPEKSKDALPEGPDDGADDGVALDSKPAACVES